MDTLINFLQQHLADFWTYPILRNMLAGTMLVSLSCSLLSVFVVLKKMAFIGQGISHAAFGGIALGMLLFPALTSPNWIVYLITLSFCIIVALTIGFASRTKKITEDSAIGILFASSMALGVIFLSLRQSYTSDVFNYLFGTVMAITVNDLYLLSGLTVLVLLSHIIFFKEYYVYCYDETYADTLGIPTGFLHYWLLILLSITIVLSAKIVGVILVTAFLVIPGACAQLMTWRFNRMVVISVMIGIITSFAGIYISSQGVTFLNRELNFPPGALIVTLQFIFFVLLLVFLRFKSLFFKG